MDKKAMIEALIDHYTEGNKAQFAKLLGISPQTVSAWVTRHTFDSELIYTKCRYVNASWLLTGEGEMLKSPHGEPSPSSSTSKKSKEEGVGSSQQPPSQPTAPSSASVSPFGIRKLPQGSQKGIPLIPLSAMAGAFTSDISVMEYECERYVVPSFEGADFLIPVKGDSMQPTYLSGDLVACQKISLTDIFFQWNKTYVLDTDQGALIKRVCQGSDTDHILLVSDNECYPPFELSLSHLHAIALVRGIIRLE